MKLEEAIKWLEVSVHTTKIRTKDKIAYPEIPDLPANTIGFCPLLKNTPSGWPPGMPVRVQKAIAKAVPTFGMTIKVFYPVRRINDLGWDPDPLWGRKCDPLVIGENDGKHYLIAAWE